VLLSHLNEGINDGGAAANDDDEEEKRLLAADPNNIRVSTSYCGPHIQFPMTVNQLQQLIAGFKNEQV